MRPLSFTRNIGGLAKVHAAIRRGYAPGITTQEFRKRCGLSASLSHVVTEFFLCTTIRAGKEYIVHDILIDETLARRSFDVILARLYFFALNLGIPGQRLREDQQAAGALQRYVLTRHVYAGNAWRVDRIDKDGSLEPFVRATQNFPSARKWVNNYWNMMGQCRFVAKPDGILETFPDTWAPIAVKLFFDRFAAERALTDADQLSAAALDNELYRLIGVAPTWVGRRIEGLADIFVAREPNWMEFGAELESNQEREAARLGRVPARPRPGTSAHRRGQFSERLVRRTDNREFIRRTYNGACQMTGTILRLPSGKFSVDCAHIRPLARPHLGPDDVGNMLSLSPTMHRLFDRGCVRIDPRTYRIQLLHGNEHPHLPRLLVNTGHGILREHIDYFNQNILNG